MSFSAGNLKEKTQEMSSLWLSDFLYSFIGSGTIDESNVTLTNQKKHAFSRTNQLNQSGAKEAQPTQPIKTWRLRYVFPRLAPVTGFPALGNRYMFSRASHRRVVLFSAFGTIRLLSRPWHRFELQLNHCVICASCDWSDVITFAGLPLIWTLPSFAGYRKNERGRFEKTLSK